VEDQHDGVARLHILSSSWPGESVKRVFAQMFRPRLSCAWCTKDMDARDICAKTRFALLPGMTNLVVVLLLN
jgi:hypothetical protein